MYCVLINPSLSFVFRQCLDQLITKVNVHFGEIIHLKRNKIKKLNIKPIVIIMIMYLCNQSSVSGRLSEGTIGDVMSQW